ncbi:MAG: hypothetical protein HC938_15005 [Nitrospira sp.]|nr:hypothetical protein [Nitrospira sp.]
MVAAGIRRAVNEGCLTGVKKVGWLQIQPGRGKTPFESLSWPLIETFHRISFRPGELASQLANGTQTIGRLLDAHLPSGQELLLFVDQLEELFTTGFSDHDVAQFLKAIVNTCQETPSRLRVIGTVRSEFIARLQETEAVLDAMNGRGSHFLGPISPKALHEMIEKPAQATGYEFESGLVDELLRDAAQEPGSLPLVAYAMNQLFGQLSGGNRTFTHEAYQAIGRVVGAIGTQADRVLQGLGRDVDAAFDRVFAELVNIERDRPRHGSQVDDRRLALRRRPHRPQPTRANPLNPAVVARQPLGRPGLRDRLRGHLHFSGHALAGTAARRASSSVHPGGSRSIPDALVAGVQISVDI